jgi:hypothetical protein
MAKAKIEFDLNDIDDRMAHLRAVKSLDMAMALWDITHNTKKGLEWALENKDVDKYEVLEMVFEKIYEILDEHNVNTDELVI